MELGPGFKAPNPHEHTFQVCRMAVFETQSPGVQGGQVLEGQELETSRAPLIPFRPSPGTYAYVPQLIGMVLFVAAVDRGVLGNR